MSEPADTLKRRTFLQNSARWFAWITLFGGGYHGGQALTLAAIGRPLEGIVILTTGVAGYMIAGIIGGLLVALIMLAVTRIGSHARLSAGSSALMLLDLGHVG